MMRKDLELLTTSKNSLRSGDCHGMGTSNNGQKSELWETKCTREETNEWANVNTNIH